MLLPISAIVPTRNRTDPLEKMLRSLAQQSAQPAELIVVDASSTNDTEQLCRQGVAGLVTELKYYKANQAGAAVQRKQALRVASQDNVLFLDDDIVFEHDCITRLWEAVQSDPCIGGVNAMITNQRFTRPGLLTRTLFRCLDGRVIGSYAGKVIGPACNILPEDDPELPETMAVDWLNTTCTLYRREALPDPLFADQFQGYSLLEDLALSLQIAKEWKLVNARTARIFHDSQPGEHKSDPMVLAKMELVNRHFVMTKIMGRRNLSDYFKLAVFESFGILTPLTSSSNWRSLPAVTVGKLKALGSIVSANHER